jgi:hypothetical protein
LNFLTTRMLQSMLSVTPKLALNGIVVRLDDGDLSSRAAFTHVERNTSMTSGTEIIQCKAAIQKTLSKIGKTNGTAPPPSRRNIFPALYEFFVADTLRSAINKRYDAAKASIIEQQQLALDDFPESTQSIEASTEHLDLLVKKAAGSSTIDKTALRNELSKRFGTNVADEIIEKSSKPKRGAVTISAVMK